MRFQVHFINALSIADKEVASTTRPTVIVDMEELDEAICCLEDIKNLAFPHESLKKRCLIGTPFTVICDR